jgi:hypothetical protein
MRKVFINIQRKIVLFIVYLSSNQALIHREETDLDHPQYLNTIKL